VTFDMWQLRKTLTYLLTFLSHMDQRHSYCITPYESSG